MDTGVVIATGVYEVRVDAEEYHVQNNNTGVLEFRSSMLPEALGYMKMAADAWKREVEAIPTLASIN